MTACGGTGEKGWRGKQACSHAHRSCGSFFLRAREHGARERAALAGRLSLHHTAKMSREAAATLELWSLAWRVHGHNWFQAKQVLEGPAKKIQAAGGKSREQAFEEVDGARTQPGAPNGRY